jgi:hypothetical protein
MKRRRGVATAARGTTVCHSDRFREVRCHVSFLSIGNALKDESDVTGQNLPPALQKRS